MIAGVPGDTTKVQLGDTAETLLDNNLYLNANGKPPIGALITAETANVRFTLGPTGNVPTQGNAGLGHVLASGASLELTNGAQVRTASFISHTGSGVAVIQVTLYYEVGA
jgi:hypothetical protein